MQRRMLSGCGLRKSACNSNSLNLEWNLCDGWNTNWKGNCLSSLLVFCCVCRVSATLLLLFRFCFLLDTTICLLFFVLTSMRLCFFSLFVRAVARTTHSQRSTDSYLFLSDSSHPQKNNEFHSIYISQPFFHLLHFNCPETARIFSNFRIIN